VKASNSVVGKSSFNPVPCALLLGERCRASCRPKLAFNFLGNLIGSSCCFCRSGFPGYSSYTAAASTACTSRCSRRRGKGRSSR